MSTKYGDENNYLVVEHTETLALGKDNADFTITFAYLNTVPLKLPSSWRTIFHKGNEYEDRTPLIKVSTQGI